MKKELKIENLIKFMEREYDLLFYHNFKNYYQFIVSKNEYTVINVYTLKQLRDIYRGEVK